MREYVLTLLVTAAVTYMLTPAVRWIAIKFGAVIPARDRDVHASPIPRMGGLAMYLGVAAGLLVAQEMVPLRDAFPGSGLIFGLLGAGGLIVVIGIIDDRWGMSAIGKLIGQVAAAVILFDSGARLSTFPGPNREIFILTRNESIVLTILVVVATINAVNFIDGLDGLAGGIVFISAISFFAYYYSLVKVAQLPAMAAPALAAIVLAGACLGFLPHNFFPSRIFMGDTGSMLLGLLLAYVPIQAISQLDWASLSNKANRYAEILPLLLPAAVLVIPYFDMLRAVVRRTRAGMSPLAPDRKHLHHRLLEIGHSHRASVLILYSWAALFSAVVIALSILTVPLAVLLLTTLAAILLLALLSMPKLRWWERAKAVAQHSAAAVAQHSHSAAAVAQHPAATQQAEPAVAEQPAPAFAQVPAAPDPVQPDPVQLENPAQRENPARRGDMLFRPVEPTPVHPLDATMPMPAARKSATLPAAHGPAASGSPASGSPAGEPAGNGTTSTPAARVSGRVVP